MTDDSILTDTTENNHVGAARLPAQGHASWRSELKALLWLGVPMALTQIVQFSVYTIDVLMIGRVGPEALASASLGLVIFYAVWMLYFGPVMAISPMVSQVLGGDRNNTRDARRSVRMGLWVVLTGYPIALVIFFFAKDIAIALGQNPVLAEKAGEYILALSPSLLFMMGILTLRNFLATINRTIAPLIVTLICVFLNAGFNYIFIFGHFGVPAMGVVGAGIASSIANAIGFALLVIYVCTEKEARKFEIFHNFHHSDWERYKEVIRLGWPIGVTTLFEGMLFNSAVFLVGLIGMMQMAAYQIALNVVALAFMMPLGFSMAGSVRVGLAAGAGDLAGVRRASAVTLLACLSVMGVMAIIVAVAPRFIGNLYLSLNEPDNLIVLDWVAKFLPIAAMFMMFDAAQVAANQLLRGLKDVQMPMILTGISYWAVGFPVAWWLGLHTPMGAVGVWYGLLAGLVMAAVTLNARLWLFTRKPIAP